MEYKRKESKAKEWMKSMGWEEGLGLGKDNQGMKHAIKPKKKIDNAGLGKIGSNTRWLTASNHYDAILAKLNVAYSAESSAQDTESNSELEQKSKKTKKSSKKEKKSQKRKLKETDGQQDDAEPDTKRSKKDKKAKKDKKERKEKKAKKDKKSKKEKEDDSEGEDSPTNSTPARRAVFAKRLQAKQAANYSSAHKAEILARPSARQGFTEDTQVDIYNQVFEKQKKGRDGVGLGSRLSKSQRREVAQRDAQLMRTGRFLSKHFVYGGLLGDMEAALREARERREADPWKMNIPSPQPQVA